MKDPDKRRYLYLMLSMFSAISLSIVVFFVVYRFQGIGDIVHRLGEILAPFIYGGIVAYLLRPMCNFFEQSLETTLPGKVKRMAAPVAVALSLLTGILLVYMLIIMVRQLVIAILLLPSCMKAFSRFGTRFRIKSTALSGGPRKNSVTRKWWPGSSLCSTPTARKSTTSWKPGARTCSILISAA